MNKKFIIKIFIAGGQCLFLVVAQYAKGAAAPSPADGTQAEASGLKLKWKRDDHGPDKFLVFIGTDRQKVDEAFYRNHPDVKVYECSEPSIALPDLAPEKVYFWRVDKDNDALPLKERKGKVWSFTAFLDRGPRRLSDEFCVVRDYLSHGMDGTIWDGVIGLGKNKTVERLAVADGLLHIESRDGFYQGNSEKLGPLIYKQVNGDFKATVKVVDYQFVAYNNCGIMVRVPVRDDAGDGEDWISIDYFPLYGGIYARSSDDGRRDEICNNGQGRESDKYLQLEKVGNRFYLRHSPDGASWKELPCSPVIRNDLVGRPLQVGLFHATYSGNKGHVSFDEYVVEIGREIRTARIGSPADGDMDVPSSAKLVWIPGAGSVAHDLYFGNSREAVAKAGRESPEHKGRMEAETVEFALSGLPDGAVCYWRVDELDGEGKVHKGEVWSFTTYDRVLADFEGLSSVGDAASGWVARGNAQLSVVKSSPGGGRALLMSSADPKSSAAAEHVFAGNQDWLSSQFDFRRLTLDVKGDSRNRSCCLALEFEDNDWGAARSQVEYDGDLNKGQWNTWEIDLHQLVENSPRFRLTAVRKMSLILEGKGSVTVDNIRIDTVRRNADGTPWPRYINPERFVEPVSFDKARVTGGIWYDRIETNRQVSLPHVWGRCESSKKANGDVSRRLDNFKKAAGMMEGGFSGISFNDSDVYKIIQGTAYSLQNTPDPELEAYTDQVIDWIAGAQWDDGYLFTHYSIPKTPKQRWSNIGHVHELYCAGHLCEAGVAYYRATGKRKLLDVSIRFADYICKVFGPGKIDIPPGHQEIEIALMQLYHTTGEKRYMDLAKFFIDMRGVSEKGGRADYHQSHKPFVDQEKGVGHSVRAGYMYCAAADIAMVNHDEAYGRAMYRLWENITNTKTYLTGGIGQPGGPEGFTGDYQLGNSCYAETCSGIAFAMWNHRLHLMSGESKYIDSMERTFYNNTLGSLSICGRKHYYTNPLMTDGRERWEWPGHDCACCPSSLVRTIASIGGYAYTHKGNALTVNMYIQGDVEIELPGNKVKLRQQGNYPRDGDIKLTVDPAKTGPFSVNLRIPGWARGVPLPGNLYRYLDESSAEIALSLNGKAVDFETVQGYITIDRKWKAGDEIHLHLPMPVRRVIAHPKAIADNGLVAVERGPLVYCAEHCDNDFNFKDLCLADSSILTAQFEKDLFNGVTTISSADTKLKLIPYYLYSNRKPGWMRVWMKRVK